MSNRSECASTVHDPSRSGANAATTLSAVLSPSGSAPSRIRPGSSRSGADPAGAGEAKTPRESATTAQRGAEIVGERGRSPGLGGRFRRGAIGSSRIRTEVILSQQVRAGAPHSSHHLGNNRRCGSSQDAGRNAMTHRAGRLVVAAFVCLVLGLLAAGPARAVIQGTTWFPIGPAPSCCFFPGGEAGRATSVAVNPSNFNEIWIGTANGGLWRSTDGATTWLPMTDDQASLAIGSIAVADCTSGGCDSVYAGTGENAIRRDTYYGRGLLVGRRAGPGGGT